MICIYTYVCIYIYINSCLGGLGVHGAGGWGDLGGGLGPGRCVGLWGGGDLPIGCCKVILAIPPLGFTSEEFDWAVDKSYTTVGEHAHALDARPRALDAPNAPTNFCKPLEIFNKNQLFVKNLHISGAYPDLAETTETRASLFARALAFLATGLGSSYAHLTFNISSLSIA